MKQLFVAALVFANFCESVLAGEVSSAYSDLDFDKDCTIFATAEEGDGEWANLVCNGYRGYPVFIYSGDLRDSAYYGFPPAGDRTPASETFSAFNSVGPKIEWRLETSNGNAVPFATIHRRLVYGGGDGSSTIEVLAISKIGQPDHRNGCVVGLVLASGQSGANQAAREIADTQARGFACGADRPVSVGEPMPNFQRSN